MELSLDHEALSDNGEAHVSAAISWQHQQEAWRSTCSKHNGLSSALKTTVCSLASSKSFNLSFRSRASDIMSVGNEYLDYKKDTRCFLFWLCNTYNRSFGTEATSPDEASNSPKDSSYVGVNEIVQMASYIARTPGHKTPFYIFRLLQWTIKGRKTVHMRYKGMVTEVSDLDIEKSNVSHKMFIDALEQAFVLLGRPQWQAVHQTQPQTERPDADDEFQLFLNSFEALATTSSSSSHEGEASEPHSPSFNLLEMVDMDSYKLIEDNDDLELDYSLVVACIASELQYLRIYVQGLWRDVAYRGSDSAVAGIISRAAIEMIQKTARQMFVDFDGLKDSCDAFENAMHHYLEERKTGTSSHSSTQEHSTALPSVPLDTFSAEKRAKESICGYAYDHLLEFLKDFQKNQTGQPTKRKKKTLLSKWDPDLNLQEATDQERIDWRRAYTIKWLYEMVNVYVFTVLGANIQKADRAAYWRRDWSVKVPRSNSSRLFGIEDFARFITSMAMREPSDNDEVNCSRFVAQILPDHVFQLQCLIDSFLVSRGWSTTLDYYLVGSPAVEFRPAAQLISYLHDASKLITGTQTLYKLINCHGVPSRSWTSLNQILDVMGQWLGKSKQVFSSTLGNIAVSQFSLVSDDLWNLSPFLCGSGYAEALELAYRMSMLIWDEHPEFTYVMHLYNMALKRGYLDEPLDLLEMLQAEFRDAIYNNGEIPTENFFGNLSQSLARGTMTALSDRSPDVDHDFLSFLNLEANARFQHKSTLILYRERGWSPNTDKIKNQYDKISSFTNRVVLDIMKFTIESEVCGPNHLSNLTFPQITSGCFQVLVSALEKLPGTSNPVLRKIGEQDSNHGTIRVLVKEILQEQDGHEECLKIVANLFEQSVLKLKFMIRRPVGSKTGHDTS